MRSGCAVDTQRMRSACAADAVAAVRPQCGRSAAAVWAQCGRSAAAARPQCGGSSGGAALRRSTQHEADACQPAAELNNGTVGAGGGLCPSWVRHFLVCPVGLCPYWVRHFLVCPVGLCPSWVRHFLVCPVAAVVSAGVRLTCGGFMCPTSCLSSCVSVMCVRPASCGAVAPEVVAWLMQLSAEPALVVPQVALSPIIASDGLEAIAAFEAAPVDLILMDVQASGGSIPPSPSAPPRPQCRSPVQWAACRPYAQRSAINIQR